MRAKFINEIVRSKDSAIEALGIGKATMFKAWKKFEELRGYWVRNRKEQDFIKIDHYDDDSLMKQAILYFCNEIKASSDDVYVLGTITNPKDVNDWVESVCFNPNDQDKVDYWETDRTNSNGKIIESIIVITRKDYDIAKIWNNDYNENDRGYSYSYYVVRYK